MLSLQTRAAIEAAERFAEGAASQEAFNTALNEAYSGYYQSRHGSLHEAVVYWALVEHSSWSLTHSASLCAGAIADSAAPQHPSVLVAVKRTENAEADARDCIAEADIAAARGMQAAYQAAVARADAARTEVQRAHDNAEAAYAETHAAAERAERAVQAALARCIIGPLPFRPVGIAPSLLKWNGGAVLKLARGIYEERAFDRMAVPADALEEAGCENQDILLHCRSPGEHVPGCWVVDLVLGKS
jgi:hypothetical protein